MAIATMLALAGCTTTMHAAQRERLESARQRAALQRTRVTVANPLVTVTSPAVISSGKRTAFVVTVRNHSRRAVTDLPISIGYTTAGGASVYVNAGAGLAYFDAHLPAIRAGHELTWVYTAQARVPAGARTFARVGRTPSAPALLTEPDVHIGLGYSTASSGSSLNLTLQNGSGVPQYELRVYAYARRDSRYLAAGEASVAALGSGARAHLRLPLIGSATGHIHVDAVPTILQ